MTTSSTKLLASLAITAGLLFTNAALAKGGPGNGGGNGGNHSPHMNSNFSAVKMSSNNSSFKNFNKPSNNFNSISKKNLTLSQSFKKQDFNSIHKNSPLGISVNSLKKDNHSKNLFFKKDNKWCWFDSCYPKKSCYPYNFGCYPTYSCCYPTYTWCFPTYGCYDYSTPAYTSTGYNSGITVLQNMGTSRTRVAVGSVLMVGGQAFGDKPGGARLRISGMAMPIEVLEWAPAGVKVRLPQVEITANTPADIEVFRGDGSLASKAAVELTASPEQLALGR